MYVCGIRQDNTLLESQHCQEESEIKSISNVILHDAETQSIIMSIECLGDEEYQNRFEPTAQ